MSDLPLISATASSPVSGVDAAALLLGSASVYLIVALVTFRMLSSRVAKREQLAAARLTFGTAAAVVSIGVGLAVAGPVGLVGPSAACAVVALLARRSPAP